MAEITDLLGLILHKIEGSVGDNELKFYASDGRIYTQYHNQDCCENVTIEDICGDLDDLIGSPILEAEEETNSDESPQDATISSESFTWTFYKLGTIKGHVTIRWLGESNGYYSESVDMKVS